MQKKEKGTVRQLREMRADLRIPTQDQTKGVGRDIILSLQKEQIETCRGIQSRHRANLRKTHQERTEGESMRVEKKAQKGLGGKESYPIYEADGTPVDSAATRPLRKPPLPRPPP